MHSGRAKNKTLRILQADGRGKPVVIAEGVWHDLATVPLDDPRLWAATNYSMPVEQRVKLLGVSEARAVRDRRRCLARVEAARASKRP